MPTTQQAPSWPLIAFPLFKLTILLLAIKGYGIFRDELYYIACSERLAWGYVDHPPLSIAILRLVREALGDSLFALRLLPAIASALTVLLVGLITRRLGGDLRAHLLAMISALAIPMFWGVGHVYSMNVFDILIWSAVAYVVTCLVSPGTGSGPAAPDRHRLWIVLGIVLGLGLLNKLSVLWLGFGLGVGLLATPQRRWLLSRGPWLTAGIALTLFSPHIIWQTLHGWPTLEFIANATREKMVSVSPVAFFQGQVDLLGGWPVAIVAVLGLGSLFVGRGRRFRILGWIYLTVFVLLMANGSSRAGYLAPAYTWLLAAGGVASSRLLDRLPSRRLRGAAFGVSLILIGIYGVIAAPFALPILTVERFVAYSRALGITPSTEERKELATLPQFYADMHGWQAKADAARQAFEALSATERESVCFWSWNYGVASAIEHLGGPDLPPSLSGHNNFWLWGPDDCTGEILIVMGGSADGLRERFARVEEILRIDCDHCMPYEDQQPVYLARGPNVSVVDVWGDLKHFD